MDEEEEEDVEEEEVEFSTCILISKSPLFNFDHSWCCLLYDCSGVADGADGSGIVVILGCSHCCCFKPFFLFFDFFFFIFI